MRERAVINDHCRTHCKGQLAENLPGAVKMFADALTGGDTTKLFKLMEDGKIGLEELQKVIDHMASIVDPELVNKMANTPAKKFEKMRTAWVRMLEATNDAGILNLMVKTFEEMTDVLEDLARWVRLNKEGFETFGKVVGRAWLVLKTAIQMLLPYWKEILALFAAAKLWAIGAALLELSGVTLTLGTSVAILAKAVGGLMLRLFLVPLLIAGAVAALLDLNDAVNGKNSFFKDWAKDDQWYSGFAKFVLLLADAVEYSKELLTSGAVELFGRLTGNKELVAYAQESREKATKRSAALKEEINPSDNMQYLLDSTMTNMRRSIAPLFALEVIEHIRAGVTQISSDQSPQPNPQRSMFGQGAQGQGVITLPSQSPQATQVNHITVHAPVREGKSLGQQIATVIPNFPRTN